MSVSNTEGDSNGPRDFSARAHREALARFLRCVNAGRGRSWPRWEIVAAYGRSPSIAPVVFRIPAGGAADHTLTVSLEWPQRYEIGWTTLPDTGASGFAT
jgi:hypothetical protein